MPKVSIIVPAYNIELYIGKCIDSLVSQTLKDIEIIIVNDGAKDRTDDVIRKKLEKYNDDRILYFTKENGGLSDTRNFGISKASGEYIAFVDGDDYIEPEMFELMYKKTEEYPYDVVACDVNCKYPNRDLLIKSGISESKRDLSVEDKKEIIHTAYVVAWNKIYRKELFTEDKLFVKNVWFEDVLFFYKLVPFIQSIGIVEKSLYNYIQRTNSITYTYSDKLYDINKNLKTLVNYYEEQGLTDEYKDILEFVYVRYMYGTFVKRLAKSKDKTRFNTGVDFAIKDVKEMFPDYKKNRFLCSGGGKNFYLKSFNKLLSKIIYVIEKNRMN